MSHHITSALNSAGGGALIRGSLAAAHRLGISPLLSGLLTVGFGTSAPELPNSVYREVVVPPCRIFYRGGDKRVLILYVMREERQLRAYMLENS